MRDKGHRAVDHTGYNQFFPKREDAIQHLLLVLSVPPLGDGVHGLDGGAGWLGGQGRGALGALQGAGEELGHPGGGQKETQLLCLGLSLGGEGRTGRDVVGDVRAGPVRGGVAGKIDDFI